jgi:hypothetical protein
MRQEPTLAEGYLAFTAGYDDVLGLDLSALRWEVALEASGRAFWSDFVFVPEAVFVRSP